MVHIFSYDVVASWPFPEASLTGPALPPHQVPKWCHHLRRTALCRLPVRHLPFWWCCCHRHSQPRRERVPPLAPDCTGLLTLVAPCKLVGTPPHACYGWCLCTRATPPLLANASPRLLEHEENRRSFFKKMSINIFIKKIVGATIFEKSWIQLCL
jgi:hypothetical protein